MTDLPRSIDELRALVEALAPEAYLDGWVGPNRLLLDGEETSFVFSFDGDALRFEEQVEEMEDADGAPSLAEGEAGVVSDVRHLARVIGWALGLRSVVDYHPDPEAYLRTRAETGVARS